MCGGFAEYFNLDPVLVRLIWIFLVLFGGSGIIAYILAFFLIPEAGEPSGLPFYKRIKFGSVKSSIWGIIIIVVGIILVFQYHGALGTALMRFWKFGFNLVVAAILIGIGVYLLSNRTTNLAKTVGISTKTPLHLSNEQKLIFGVCGGLAESFGIDVVLIRMFWAFSTIMSVGAGIILYIALVLFMPSPEEKD